MNVPSSSEKSRRHSSAGLSKSCVSISSSASRASADGARLRCVELATGKVRWMNEGFGCANMILAEGRLITLSEDGDLLLLEANPDEYKELARIHVLRPDYLRERGGFSLPSHTTALKRALGDTGARLVVIDDHGSIARGMGGRNLADEH